MRLILSKDVVNIAPNLITEEGKRPTYSVERIEDIHDELIQGQLQSMIAEAGMIVISKEPIIPVIRTAMPAHGTVLFSKEQPVWIRQPPFIIIGTQKPAEHSFSMREISLECLRETSDSAMSVARQWPSLHISINADVLDSLENPGGLSVRELITFIQRLRLLKNYRSADIHGALHPTIIAKLAAELV